MTSVHQWSLKSLSKQISGEPAKEGYTNNKQRTRRREKNVSTYV